ncbi:MAG: hypothetical protein DRP11_00055 [Candidatus Aenigmatarchaeota archaeon]|nr:MAG: hypothetical protein DRP11_00055 [Candidatus Aenigmarchaeota archaeon]
MRKFSFLLSLRRLFRRFRFYLVLLRKKLKNPCKILLQVLGIALFYGLIINYVLWALFDYPFSIRQVFGWGFLFYFLKYEVIDRLVGFLFQFFK